VSRRKITEEERKLFEQNFREALPLQTAQSKRTAKTKGAIKGPSGVNGATQDKLRRGLMEPDARIDLHGMTQAAAHRTLFTWLAAAHSRGYRLVLVVTGKGNPKNDENAPWMMSAHGVLKQMVPRWLNEPELAALIASVQPAHVKHGGGGALYVYLRKRT
jgi:DNA-nicking Smr family endonuclease